MAEDILRSNRIEDVRWLCSLSESELDMVISLKQLVLRRARVIGHESLAAKFDLKMLLALGFILMEHLKQELRNSADIPCLIECPNLLDRCNLLSCGVNNSFADMGIEELRAYIKTTKRRRTEMYGDDGASRQKMKH